MKIVVPSGNTVVAGPGQNRVNTRSNSLKKLGLSVMPEILKSE
jgi:hypothetical protein